MGESHGSCTAYPINLVPSDRVERIERKHLQGPESKFFWGNEPDLQSEVYMKVGQQS